MKCPKCKFENREGAKFCKECGHKLEATCSQCGAINLPDSKFCDSCGQRLEEEPPPKEKFIPIAESERKHVTVLFSDMSGYTAMTEKLDPEETKEIMGKIFGEISKVVAKYEGFIEKFIGDAVMAIFGATTAHEDDPVRAIKASREIHDVVSSLSSQFEKRIGKALCMHTGICTGLVVTGEVNLERGTHGVLGDTINTAARLSGIAKPGEIVISPDTYYQSEGYFNFEALEPTTVKGKTELLRPYKVLSPREEPTKTHRLSGMRAELIGRKVEMSQLQDALNNLKQGKGSIFSVVGEAGTGKSRLIEEFKASLDLNTVQWREGHSYAYAQNIPYFPLIDLLSRAYQIQEGDSPEQVRQKVETGTKYLIGEREDLIPYVGSLYSLSYPDIERVSPEFWKARLHEAVQKILSALTQKGPTVVCLEDLHWADLSSVELLRNILFEFRYPALFLCMYRPPFSLFTSHKASSMAKVYKEIKLHDLSTSESQDMVESLLRVKDIPPELRRFIQERVEGNPFYLEEAINDLIESAILVRDNGSWKLTKSLLEANIPSTVQGIISARLDRLERETKRILQEASVIGRAFLYEILNRITELKEHIDRSLTGLERLDLIRVRSLQPEMEYIFKHALAQEVVYNGLIKKERQAIHEKIGTVMEQLFKDRLPEFYETLAFHFQQGQSTLKAVDYLMKAGEKSLNRYSLDEAHRYFQEAFDILSNKENRSREDDKLIIDLLFKWFLVYYYYGDWKKLTELLLSHKGLAESLDDKATLGRFYSCLGFVLHHRLRLREGYDYLHQAILLGEEANNRQVIGYAACLISWTCAYLGLMDQGIAFGKKAQEMSRFFPADHYLYFKSLAGIGFNYYCKGEGRKVSEIAEELLEYGRRHSNIRSMVLGHVCIGMSGGATGNFHVAIQSGQMGAKIARDRLYKYLSSTVEATGYALAGQLAEAQEVFEEISSYSHEYGCDVMEVHSDIFLGAIYVAQGHMNHGLTMIEEARGRCEERGEKNLFITAEYILGRIYKQIAEGAGPISPVIIAKNIGFLVKNVPFSAKKAENHFLKAIEVAQEIGAKGILGQIKLDLGLLHKTKGRTDEARKCFSEAIQLFEECEADVFLKQAREALAALG